MAWNAAVVLNKKLYIMVEVALEKERARRLKAQRTRGNKGDTPPHT